jgi:pimeloyl-[acyl-carrier protein] methyl ester esterase
LNLYVESQGQGRPLVLLHGWGLNGAIWEGLAQDLSRRLATCAIDLPGFGRSPPCGKTYSLDLLTKLLITQIPPHSLWLGWSLGGTLAMYAALRFPEQVSGLILIATTPRFTLASDWPWGVPPALFEDFEREVMEGPEQALNRFASLLAHGDTQAKSVIREVRKRMSQFGPGNREALLGGLQVLAGADLRSKAPQIRCPVLVLLGEVDKLVPVSAAAPLSSLFSHGRVEVIPGASHAPFLSCPERSAHLITGFIDEHLLA